MSQELQGGGATGETPADTGSDFDWGFDRGPDPEASGTSLADAVEIDSEGGPSSSGEPSQADATKTADLSGEGVSPDQKPSQEPTKPGQDGDQTPEPTSQPAAEKFKFLGREYDSIQDAEKVLGSWEGRIQAEQRRASTLEFEVQQYYDYAQDVYRKNQELLAQLEGKGSAGGTDGKTSASEDAIAGLDWKQIREVTELAKLSGHDPVEAGLKMVAEQLSDRFATQMREELRGIREPLELRQAQEEAVQLSYDMFIDASKARGSTGQLLYPELWAGEDGQFDPKFAREMYSTWSNLARKNPHIAFSQGGEGVDYAYRLTRERYTPSTPENIEPGPTGDGNDSANHPEAKPTPARNAKGQFVKAQHSAAKAEPTSSDQTPIGKPEPTLEDAVNDDLFERLGGQANVVLDGEDMGFSR